MSKRLPSTHPANVKSRTLPLPRSAEQLNRRDTLWRKTALPTVLIIVALLGVTGVLSLVLPKPEVSGYENRALAKKPEFTVEGLISGKYIADLELYYSDTFPFREGLVRAAGRIEECFGVRGKDDVRIHNAPDPEQKPAEPIEPQAPKSIDAKNPDPSDKKEPAQASSSQPEQPQDVQGEQVGGLFIVNGQVFSLFSPNNRASGRYAAALNNWHQTLGDDVTIYNLVIPTAAEFAMPPKYQDLSKPQKPNIDYIYSLLDPAIKAVDAHSNIAKHLGEYLYFRTDHHWTGLGAYYAYQAFCEKAGFTPVALDNMEKRTIPDFIGSLYTQTQDSTLLRKPDYVDYWVIDTPHEVAQFWRGAPFTPHPSTLLGEHAKSPNCYSVFLNGDYPLTKITTDIKNGRKIAVVKESFGNAFCPFLVNHYEEVHVVDQRYFQLNLPGYLRDNNIHELLFINNIYAANTDVRIQETERLLTQVYVPYVPKPVEEEPPEEEPEPEPEPEPSSSSRVEFDPWADEFKDVR